MAKTAKAKPCESSTPVRPGMDAAYYHLHSLLGTLRQLACHEDQVCTLLAEMERSGKVTASVRRELAALLGELHVQSLQHEVHALARVVES